MTETSVQQGWAGMHAVRTASFHTNALSETWLSATHWHTCVGTRTHNRSFSYKVKKQAKARPRRQGSVLRTLLERVEDLQYPTAVIRDLRAIETLERIATPDAVRVLENLAKGSAESPITEDAKRSLQRIINRLE